MGSPFRNLVFEGGGVWGIAYEGVLAELEGRGILGGIRRVGGASAGAITAALLAAGGTAASLGRMLRSTNFAEFADDDAGFARDTVRLLSDYGWYKGEKFRGWVRHRIADRVNDVSRATGVPSLGTKPTMAQLRGWQDSVAAATGRRLPELFIVGTNLSQQRREVYSADDSPDLPVEDAVRRSMSIPLFFACARGKGKDVLVDGGLSWNYPVNLFDDAKYLADDANGLRVDYSSDAAYRFNTETLGFRLDTTKEVQWNLKDWQSEPLKIDNILQYGWALVSFMRAVANKVHLHKNDWSRTVFVDVGERIGFTDFDLKDADKDFLSNAGREGVGNYLAWRNSAEGKSELAAIYAGMQPT
jgi:NTE family protein